MNSVFQAKEAPLKDNEAKDESEKQLTGENAKPAEVKVDEESLASKKDIPTDVSDDENSGIDADTSSDDEFYCLYSQENENKNVNKSAKPQDKQASPERKKSKNRKKLYAELAINLRDEEKNINVTSFVFSMPKISD